MSLPDRFDIRPVPGKQGGDAVEEPRDLTNMLLSGDLDAVMDPAGSVFHAVDESDSAEFVFEDPLEAERRYYEETGIHPPMHTVAIRDEILEEHPWVARNVYDAFCAARDRAIERNRSAGVNTLLTWAHLYFREQKQLFGEDMWEYGLTDGNVRELSKFVEYTHDQGLIPTEYDVESLFFETTVGR